MLLHMLQDSHLELRDKKSWLCAGKGNIKREPPNEDKRFDGCIFESTFQEDTSYKLLFWEMFESPDEEIAIKIV